MGMDPVVRRVVERFAAEKEPPYALVDIPRPEPKLLAIMQEVASHRVYECTVEIGPHGGVVIRSKGLIKPKELKRKAESIIGDTRIKARAAGIVDHGLGSALREPTITFPKDPPRQQGTGRYLHTKWTRLCKCGHPVGIHAGVKSSDGSQPCFASDYGPPCDCEKFRATTKFMSDEEYEKTYK